MNNRASQDEEFTSINKWTVKQLRSELKQRGLGTNGVKSELIQRLNDLRSSGGIMKPKVNLKNEENSDMKHRTAEHSTLQKPNGDAKFENGHKHLNVDKETERRERDSLVLWRRPVRTLYYFLLESILLFQIGITRLWRRKLSVFVMLLFVSLSVVVYRIQGAHQMYISVMEKQLVWCLYWVGLGILSSVGLGTGLHTFLLYLGPHIASVTLAAYECMSVNFPEPPYPNEIVCPDHEEKFISLWTILSKVRLEAVMWGAGTAIGELPPYFMARAARLSGEATEDEEELQELLEEKKLHPEELSFMEKLKLGVHSLVQRVGFLGILLCASIPNPLFDLAGITCGHFLIPFWTFFGATLIGKAIIKMHIQQLFVIFIFSEHHVENVVHLIKFIPRFGKSMQTPFKEWLKQQKAKLHHKPGTNVPSDNNLLSWVFEKVIIAMVVYFVVSIIHSMAQNYHKHHYGGAVKEKTQGDKHKKDH